MKNEKNIALLNELVDDVRICLFTTLSEKHEFSSRPMSTAKVDEDGNLWFFTNEYSMKSKEISRENQVTLGYSSPSKNTYLYVNGKAELVDDQVRKEAYWSPAIKAFFPEGLDDPRLTLIKVTPEVAEYWDASSSKMVLAFHMLKAIVSGETFDDGKHEKINF